MDTRKTLLERVLHAVSFELLAVAICAPLLSWLMGKSLGHMGALTLMMSLLAMGWNMAFNTLFDRAQRRLGFERTLAVHALLFEGGLVGLAVPLVAWWLGVSLFDALLLDIGILLFFLPYTMAFNWGYDVLRARWFARRAVAMSC
ncbi:multidrug/biocide efflux PACE transporter [Crenobacter cavernae]|uniref:Multidrug/biocide efflux PACE transporter n=1 Tax=Crenobacter cavernae TaxID=2290923 RepID=A0ABY0FIH3_9NEIS|nr:multidrug/biocide efflux PACE transporter [Crenobacter cavernae]RXZ44948.1 multidrug/biocide efflux PACE transporter [Crenobacter cavernae]